MIAEQNTWGINIISDKLWQLQRKENGRQFHPISIESECRKLTPELEDQF